MSQTTNENTINFDEINDNDLLHIDPKMLVDLSCGGNVRKSKRDPKKYAETKESIRLRGITQALVVRPNQQRTAFELIAGYGRRKIALELNLLSVPVMVRFVDDTTALTMAVEENMMRDDMSVLDEVKYALQIVSMYKGDYELAAKTIGWSLNKVRSRLQLNQCSESVLSALDDNQISVGHATILSVLSETIQNNTLDKIINEKWTVDILKAKLTKVQNSLSKATFDTTDCELCPHNSNGIQADIFSNTTGIQAGLCNNARCFQDKTTQGLQTIKAELEERYGNVLFMTETVAERNTVSANVVGEAQFQSGCQNCENRCAILDNRVGYSGNVINNQCLDSQCFNSIINDIKQDNEKAAKEELSQATEPSTQKTSEPEKNNAKEKPKVKTKKVKAALSNPLKAAIKNQLRALTYQYVNNNELATQAIITAALAEFAGQRNSFSESSIINCSQTTIEALQQKQTEYITAYIKDKAQAENTIIETYRKLDMSQQLVKSTWQPTKELLTLYSKDRLSTIADKSGFFDWYDAKHKDNKTKSSAKLSNGKKSDFIDALMTKEFDWKDYVPTEFLTLKS